MLFSQFIKSKCNERSCKVDEEDIDLDEEDLDEEDIDLDEEDLDEEDLDDEDLDEDEDVLPKSKLGKNKMVKNAVPRKLTNAEKAKIRELRRQRGIRTQREKDWDEPNDYEWGNSWNTMGSSYGMFESEDEDVEVVNLTPHNIVYHGKETITIEKSGIVARVDQKRKERGNKGQFRITSNDYGKIIDLPPEKDGVIYLVSALVASANKASANPRTDLYYPDDQQRDENGRVTGCRAFARGF